MRSLNPFTWDWSPSALSYKFLRFMLTPFLRRLVFFGVPAFILAVSFWTYFSDQDRQDQIAELYETARSSIINRPEFMVKLMSLRGASDEVQQDIREVIPVDFPISSFDLDLPQMQKIILGLDPVASASLQIKSGGILDISVTERVPAVVWRNFDTLEVLDETGHYVRSATSRLDYPHLPLIAGEGANTRVPEALALMTRLSPLQDRVRGLVFVGARRWDVVLNRRQRLLLPEDGPLSAVERIIAMDQAQDLLARDIVAVDLRIPSRPTLRLADNQENEGLVPTGMGN